MKIYLLLILINITVLEANDFLKKNVIFQNQIILDEAVKKDFILKKTEDKIYLCWEYPVVFDDDETKYLYVQNITDSDSIKIQIPDEIKFYYVRGFGAYKNYLYFSISKKLIIYNILTKKVETINLNRSFDFITRLKKSIYLYDYGFDSDFMGKDKFINITKIDADTKDIIYEKYLDEIYGVELGTYSPKNMIEINEEFIIISDILKYNIKIFNHDFKLLSTIKYKNKDWVNLDNKIRDRLLKTGQYFYNQNSVKKAFVPLDSICINNSRIYKIYLLNKNKLLVYWKKPNLKNFKPKDLFVELWEINLDGTYKLLKETESVKKQISLDGRQFSTLDFQIPYSFYAKDDLIIFPQSIPLDIKDFIGEDEAIINKKIENYYINNEIKYSLFIYKIK